MYVLYTVIETARAGGELRAGLQLSGYTKAMAEKETLDGPVTHNGGGASYTSDELLAPSARRRRLIVPSIETVDAAPGNVGHVRVTNVSPWVTAVTKLDSL